MNDKNKSSAEKRSFGETFKRKVLGLDKPISMKDRISNKKAADELYLRMTKPPKDYAMSEKTFKKRQQAKRRVETSNRYLNK
jgi:hypothetical protein